MKFLHTADLHIGKTLFEFPLLTEQREILRQILQIAVEEQVDGVLIAGDVYDRAVPAAEAVMVLSDFLTALSREQIPVYLVAGNHDSPERLGFGSEMLAAGGCYVAGRMESRSCYRLKDEYGTLNLYLLPYGRSQSAGTDAADEAVRGWMSEWKPDRKERNLLVTHYFVTSQGKQPELSDSEQDRIVGGLDSVEASAFDAFDYVALGHIHRPQRMGRDTICYAGSPLKYSFSEAGHIKSVVIVELREKGTVELKRRELRPLHDLRCIRGELQQLIQPEVLAAADREDYVQVTLTDEQELLEPAAALRSVYPNVCQVLFAGRGKGTAGAADGERSGAGDAAGLQTISRKSETELFREFYGQVSDREWNEEKEQIIQRVVEDLKKGKEEG